MFLYNIFIPCLIETQSRARLDGLTAQIRQAGRQLMITGLYPYCPTISDYYRTWINITFSLLFFKLHLCILWWQGVTLGQIMLHVYIRITMNLKVKKIFFFI